MTGQHLITHQSQLILRETTQIRGVHQPVRQQFAYGFLLHFTLKVNMMLQIIRCQRHLPHGVALRITDGEEVHTVLTYILHSPTHLGSQGHRLLLGASQQILALLAFHLVQLELKAAFVFADTSHRHLVANDLSSIQHGAVPPSRVVLDGLRLYATEGAQTHHHS